MVYIIYVFNLSSMNAHSAHRVWDSYMAYLKLTLVHSGTIVIICVANVCTSKTFMP